MREFIAKNSKELGICLKLLYAENVKFYVDVHENDKKKIYYSIEVDTDEQRREAIREKYRILTS